MLTNAKNVIDEALKKNTVSTLYLLKNTKDGRAIAIAKTAAKSGVNVVNLNKEEFLQKTGKVSSIAANIDEKESVYSLSSIIEKVKSVKMPLIVALDGITDVHNFGAIIRSAHFFGANAIIVPKHNSAPLNETAAKISSGASSHIPIVNVGNLSEALTILQKEGFWVYAAEGKSQTYLEDTIFDSPSVIVLGSEDKGARVKTLEKCDFLLAIKKYTDFDSLNVSNAAAVFLYAWQTQRRSS